MVNNGFELLLSSPLREDFVSWPSIASQTVYCWPLENAWMLECRLEYKSHYRMESRLQRCFASAAKGPRWSGHCVASFRILLLRVVKIEGGGGKEREVLHFFKYSENLNLWIFRVKIYKFSKELNLPRK